MDSEAGASSCTGSTTRGGGLETVCWRVFFSVTTGSSSSFFFSSFFSSFLSSVVTFLPDVARFNFWSLGPAPELELELEVEVELGLVPEVEVEAAVEPEPESVLELEVELELELESELWELFGPGSVSPSFHFSPVRDQLP